MEAQAVGTASRRGGWMSIVQAKGLPSSSALEKSNLRLWLFAIVILIYFATFASLLSLSRAASTPEQLAAVGPFSLILILACMFGSVGTTAVFVFSRRGA
jgi:hypothetical protein